MYSGDNRLFKKTEKLSLSVENKSLPPITNILSIKAQTFDDFSFREPVIRIKLNFPAHLRDFLF